MRWIASSSLIAGTCLAAALSLLPAEQARACGGFFCNAGTLSPVYQAGERVVFAPNPDGGGVTMHIEVAYQGEPTDFGWIMPLEAPVDENGEILPLEQVLHVSTSELFDVLTSATNPSYRATNRMETDSCRGNFADAGTTGGPVMDAFSSADASSPGPNEPPPVVVLQQANVGPYGAELIRATDADALYDWLAENGYLQDPAARPLLQHYVNKEFVFLGLRLQNGKAVGDLRPVELHLGETFACVPLRLTAIAATENMPMLVWVLGEHRAVPKNFIHAVINPLALIWPGASNYVEVVTEAVNSIEGRAFVTEYASTDAVMDGAFDNSSMQRLKDDVLDAETLIDFVEVFRNLGGTSDTELLNVFQNHIPMPADLRGYPHGNCYFDPYYEDGGGGWGGPNDGWGGPDQGFGCDPNDEHITSEGEFYGYLDFWIEQLAIEERPLDSVDLDALRDDLIVSYFAPRERIQGMFDRSAWITRFFTTISPTEMTRDPIFSFNPDLPALQHEHLLETVVRVDDSCGSYWLDADYENDISVRFDCSETDCWDRRGSVGPVPTAEALLYAEILDETGAPQRFAVSQANSVDEVLAWSTPGTSSLPPTFELLPPQNTPGDINVTLDGNVTTLPEAPRNVGGCGCKIAMSRSGTGSSSLWVLIGLAAGAVLRRRLNR